MGTQNTTEMLWGFLVINEPIIGNAKRIKLSTHTSLSLLLGEAIIP